VRYLEEEAIYCPVRSDRSMTQCCIQNSSYIIYNCFYFVLSVVKEVINVEKNYEWIEAWYQQLYRCIYFSMFIISLCSL